MGPASEAAGILFSEFNRLGVLEAQFYEDDSVFGARKKYEADPGQRTRFDQQLSRAEDLAKSRLSRDPRDRDALLAMTFAAGLRSDFAALIEKRNLASLHYTKEATAWSSNFSRSIPIATTLTWRAASAVTLLDRWPLRCAGWCASGALRAIRLAALPSSRRPRRKAICSPHSRASCWPSPTSARKTCRARANSCWGCNETFPTMLFLAGNWRDWTKTAGAKHRLEPKASPLS